MVKENSNGLIRAHSKVISMKTTLKELENIGGPMAESTMDNGSTIKWKALVLSLGLTEESMLENTKMIRNTAKVLLNGQMVENI